MVSPRVIAALAAAAAVTVAMPALAQAAPTAHAAGGAAVVLTYPSLVNERLVRVQSALDRATEEADEHQPNAAASTLMGARANITKAWAGAQYVIQTTPPPVADDAAFHATAFTHSGRLRIRKADAIRKVRGGVRARTAGGAAASTAATIYDTAFAVLTLQDRMETIAVGLIDTAHSTLLDSLSTTVFTALDQRDTAIAYIHSIDTTPPATDAGIRARPAGGAVVDGWATVMPGLVPLLDDEMQQQNGTLAEPALRTGTRHVLLDALAQDTATEATVNLYWPPAPVDD